MTRPLFDAQTLAASWRAWVRYDQTPRGPAWMQWLWSALLALVLAAFFTLLGMLTVGARNQAWADPWRWALSFGRNLVVTGAIAGLIHLLFDLFAPWARPRVQGWRMWQRALFFGGVPFAGVLIGWPLGLALLGVDLVAFFGSNSGQRVLWSSLALSGLGCFVMYHFFSLKARQLVAEQRATEAQLRLLQAQMEPHFLFNTLANVHSLIEHDAGKARAMLGAFTDYLRASFAGLRREAVPLADELALAEAFLRVQAVRMEGRLAWHIEADEAARRTPLPPLLLQPLVENAVLHGLEPKVEGGRVVVRAHVEGGGATGGGTGSSSAGTMLVVEVRDDGRGLAEPAQRGTGLALVNLRQRLDAGYGNAASLTLDAATPGARAVLRLPVTRAPA